MHKKVLSVVLWITFSLSTAAATNAIREVNLRIRDLVFDSVSQKVYATSPDNLADLLQLDPATGSVIATFLVGSSPHRLVIDDQRQLWIGLDGEGAVRPFNLDTLIPGTKVSLNVAANTPIVDIAPSPLEPDTVAVIAGRTYLIRGGAVQPDSIATPFGTQRIVMIGNYVFSDRFRARMTPGGLVVDGQGVGVDFEAEEGRIYLETGEILDPLTMQTVGRFVNPLGAQGLAMGVNREDNSIIFLSFGQFAIPVTITRFDRNSLEATGFFYADFNLGNIWETDLVPISTNRAAMWNDQSLFLVDLDAAFQKGDLSISARTSPNPVALGNSVEQTITVKNNGPGYVYNVGVTNLLIGNARFPEVPPDAFVPVNSEYRLPWQTDDYFFLHTILAPGDSRTFTFRVTPLSTGQYTNRVTASSGNQVEPINETVQTVVAVQNPLTNFMARLSPGGTNVSQLGYDPATDHLLLGTTNGYLFFVDLDESAITPPINFGNRVEHISVAPGVRGAWVNIYGWSSLYQVSLDDHSVSREYRMNGLLRDLDASPVDTQVAALSGANGIQLFDLVRFSTNNTTNGSGSLQFSSDGKTLYQVMDFDCSLRIFSVTNGGIIFQRWYPNVGCYDFFESDGRLYFDNGLVFDPSSGTAITNLNLPFPSFVVRDPSGPLNILTRTNNDWMVRRIDAGTFEETGRIHIGQGFAPSVLISAGTNRIAFRNGPGEAVLVRLAIPTAELRLDTLNTSGGVTVRFSSVESERYRLEESDEIINPNWRPLGEEFSGTGLIMERTIPRTSQEKFFRVVRLP